MVEFALVPIGRRFVADGKVYRKTGLHLARDGWHTDWFGLHETVRLL